MNAWTARDRCGESSRTQHTERSRVVELCAVRSFVDQAFMLPGFAGPVEECDKGNGYLTGQTKEQAIVVKGRKAQPVEHRADIGHRYSKRFRQYGLRSGGIGTDSIDGAKPAAEERLHMGRPRSSNVGVHGDKVDDDAGMSPAGYERSRSLSFQRLCDPRLPRHRTINPASEKCRARLRGLHYYR